MVIFTCGYKLFIYFTRYYSMCTETIFWHTEIECYYSPCYSQPSHKVENTPLYYLVKTNTNVELDGTCILSSVSFILRAQALVCQC